MQIEVGLPAFVQGKRGGGYIKLSKDTVIKAINQSQVTNQSISR